MIPRALRRICEPASVGGVPDERITVLTGGVAEVRIESARPELGGGEAQRHVGFARNLASSRRRSRRLTDAPPADLEGAVAQARRMLPGFAPNLIELPGHPGDSLWLMGRAPINGEPRSVQVFADPRDGSVLGWRESGALVLDRRHAMDVLYGLHMDLLAGHG